MLKHLLLVNLRNLINNKFFTLSMLLGISIALACSLYTITFLNSEYSVDSELQENRVCRILIDNPILDGRTLITFPDLASKLVLGFPEIKSSTFISWMGTMQLESNGRIFRQKNVLTSDSSFFSVFPFKLKEGTAKYLSEPNRVFLTEELALKYFGVMPSYQELILKINNAEYSVGGVLENIGIRSHMNIGILLSSSSFNLRGATGFTYLALHNGIDPKTLESKINKAGAALLPFPVEKSLNFEVQQAEDFYFHFNDFVYSYNTDLFIYQNPSIPNLVLIVGIVITILTIVNYFVFSQTRILFKAKQAVLYRIFGQNRRTKFLSSLVDISLILSVSLVVALFWIGLLSPKIKALSSIIINMEDLVSSNAIGYVLIFLALLSFTLALINTFLSEKIKTSENLSGNYTTSLISKRKIYTLITFQITMAFISLIVITGMLTQVNYIREHDMGFKSENIYNLSLGEVPQSFNLITLKNIFSNLEGISNASLCTGTPISGRWLWSYKSDNSDIKINQIYCDEEYLDLIDLNLIQGRNFNKEIKSDTLSVIVNETALRKLSLKADTTFGFYKILGVVKDFNYLSFKEAKGPVVISYMDFNKRGPQEYKLLFKANDPSVIEKMQVEWAKLFPELMFNLTVFQDEVQAIQSEDLDKVNLFTSISVIAIAITIFGLIGFSYFLVRSKRKEIAIRKVFGASTSRIRFEIFRTFLWMVLLALVISISTSWHLLDIWLKGYAEKIQIEYTIFLFPVLLMILAIVLSVSYQIMAYSKVNPAVTIRYE
jgi:putative ABC transport system permease protein